MEDWRCRAHLRENAPPAPSPPPPPPPVELPPLAPITRRAQVWELIRQNPGIRSPGIAKALGVDLRAASVFVAELRREGAVTQNGEPLRVLRPPAPQRIRPVPLQLSPCAWEGCKTVVRGRFCRHHYEANRHRSGKKWTVIGASDAALAVLEHIEGAGHPLSIKEICLETGYSYTHVCQVLISLRKEGKIQPSSSDGLARSLGAPVPAGHCSEPGCSGPIEAKGLCDAHYRRYLRAKSQRIGRILRVEDDPAQPGELTRLVIVLDQPADPAIEGQRVRVVLR